MTSAATPSIYCRSLTKVFNKRACVDRVNLSVTPGELYALLGDNGAGKTTTINMLTTLLSPTSGEFAICGFDGLKQTEKVKGMLGVVSQDVALYQELTAYENLLFVAELHGLRRERALERISNLLGQWGLADRANDLAGEFSGGMQRKLSIAMALLHEPRVIFMDEPTVGLDPLSRRQIWSMLKDLKASGVTIFLTTHYLEEAELLADRIGIIRFGALVAEGTIEDLRRKIQGIRSIAIRLCEHNNVQDLQEKIERLTARFPTTARYDSLRDTISFAQPGDRDLVQCLHEVISWLGEENISFSKFATSEPNLEEVFLAVATPQATDGEGLS